MPEWKTIVCPSCGHSKLLPNSAVPPDGTRTTCPKCSTKFLLTSQTVHHQEDKAPTTEQAHVPQKATLTVNISFKSYTVRDSRFFGKGILCLTASPMEITARRRRMFAFRRLTESYPLYLMRNVSRLGKAVRFSLPLENGYWQAMLVFHDETTAKRIEARLPKLKDSSHSTFPAAHVSGVLAGLILGRTTGTPVRLQPPKTCWLTGGVLSGITLVLLSVSIVVALAPRPGPEYRTLVKLLELTREIGTREKALAAEWEKTSVKGEAMTEAKVRDYAQRIIKTYENFDERLSALTPTTRGLKARQELLDKYIDLKKEVGMLLARAVETEDETLVKEVLERSTEATKVAKQLTKPIKWYR